MRKLSVLLVILFLFVGTVVTFAAVTFDPDTGQGFVGKGDVQEAFGWNNAQLQANAEGVTFSYEGLEEWTYDCVQYHPTQVDRELNRQQHQTSGGVDSEVVYDARTRRQITGFVLTRLSGGGATGPEFVCPTSKVVENVQLVSSGVTGLFVHYGDMSVQLSY